ncbi:hypothetical protein [Sulfobacillus thermosulfidooxidans]|uniref:hypothetical protein n=1 Tax=Sulfobacillus thermosulfidooxidans TaxID=28034 RepID=UPI0006B476C6|nr:hypothetical protein [Sulfobacillus thermosulfidooxidans]
MTMNGGSIGSGLEYVGGGLGLWGSAIMAFAVALAPETGGVSLAAAGLGLSILGDAAIGYGLGTLSR